MRNYVFSIVFQVGILAAGMVAAQDREALVEAFSKEWYQFDASQSLNGGVCTFSLGTKPASPEAPLPASTENCKDPIAQLSGWTVENGQLVLLDGSGERLAELGGNQRRLTGVRAADGLGIVIERASGDGSSTALARAVQRHRCYYLGTTSKCAPEAALKLPDFTSGEAGLAKIETLGNLAVRTQPRRDASSAGTIPQGTCVRVNQCLTASDGIWCRARFGEVDAWLSKSAVRQEEWPIVTFRNDCSAEADKG